jgi:long-subunit fatty acid transport protein
MKMVNGQKKFNAMAFILAFFIFSSIARADDPITDDSMPADPLTQIELPGSPNPVGSGARALGMGGAFISIADDATAASWNPGGLIQLEKPEISGVFGYINRKEDNTFGDHPEASGSQSVDYANLNYLSGAYPFQVGNRNMIVSLNYQHLFDFHRDWEFQFQTDAEIYPEPQQYDYRQEGALYALGIAYCAEITPAFSAGVTVNRWGDFIYQNQWKQEYTVRDSIDLGGISLTSVTHLKEEFDFSGWNANLGFLWRIGGGWTLGGVFKTPFTADIDHTTRFDSLLSTPEGDQSDSFTETADEKLHMPMAYGMGISRRFSDSFTLAVDIYRTEWDDYEYEDAEGRKTSPITGKPVGESNIDPATWYRLGAEYLIIGEKTVVPLRCGVFYDPTPSEGSADDFYGVSLGTGLAWKSVVFDIAYQYRFGNDVGKAMFEGLDFSQDVDEHTVYSSVIVHF